MTHKIVAFGASNSSKSINKKLANFAANQLDNAEVQLLDLNDFEMPIYSVDREGASGIPELAVTFKAHLKSADGIIISLAEHNGAYTTAFKNVLDWISRIKGSSVWEDKPMLLLSTSPGGRGGQSVLDLATNSFKYMNKSSITSFALPSFNENFSEKKGITNEELLVSFQEQLKTFVGALS